MRAFLIMLVLLAGCSRSEQPAKIISQGLPLPDKLRDCPVVGTLPERPPVALPKLLTTDLLRQIAEKAIRYSNAAAPVVQIAKTCRSRLRESGRWLRANTVVAGQVPVVIQQEPDDDSE